MKEYLEAESRGGGDERISIERERAALSDERERLERRSKELQIQVRPSAIFYSNSMKIL